MPKDSRAVALHSKALQKIRIGFFGKLWISKKGHAGAYREQGGHQRLHEDPWLYSIFLPIDAGDLLSLDQAAQSLRYTETMLQKGGGDWAKWYPTVRDKVIGVQNADGSWTGHHCITSRTFCTAAAILVLTSPNRYLPISQA